jgi:alkylated DNA repair dioxygenase AlkB
MTNPPIKYLPNFVDDHQEIFKTLWEGLEWVHVDETTPRLEYYCNDFKTPYTYGKVPRTYEPQTFHPAILNMRWDVEALLGEIFEVCFLNGYRDGRDHLGYHADDSPEMDDKRHIAIISLGAPREIWFRPQADKESVTKVLLGSGSLCLMEPGMQDTHFHRIPKSSVHDCGPRISLTFRGYTL